MTVEMGFNGNEILVEDGYVVSVFLYVEAVDGYSAFSSPLPFELEPGVKRADVRRLLGKPQYSGNADIDDLLGPQGLVDDDLSQRVARRLLCLFEE